MSENNKITVLRSDSQIGKSFWINENNEVVSKSDTGFNFKAVTKQVNSPSELADILKGLTTKEAIITGYCPLFDVDQEYSILTLKQFEQHGGLLPDKRAKPLKKNILSINGQQYVTRTKHFFVPSNWLCIDFDATKDAPTDLLDRVASTGVIPLLGEVIKEFEGVGYVECLSSKGRVYSAVNNMPVFNQNRHSYILMNEPQHHKVLNAIMINSRGTNIGYMSEYKNPLTGERVERLDKFNCLADQSASAIARVFYEGSPTCYEGLYAIHSEPKIVSGGVLNTDIQINNDNVDARREYINTSWTTVNTTDFTPELPIQGASGEWFTMKEVIDGTVAGFDYDSGHMRIQNPFKPESTSMSAYIRTKDMFGNGITPFIYTNEMGKYIYNDIGSIIDVFGGDVFGCSAVTPTTMTPLAPPPPPPPPVKSTMAVTNEQQSLVSQSQGVLVIPEVNMINKSNFKQIKGSMPDDVEENSQANYIVNNIMGDMKLIAIDKNEGKYFNGKFYADLNEDILDVLARRLLRNGNMGMSTHAITSLGKAIIGEINTHRDDYVKPDKRLIPFNNGVFDVVTGLFEENKGQHHFFENDVLDVNYNPTAIDVSLFLDVVNNTFEGDRDQIERALDLMAYYVCDYDNKNDIIIWFKGGSGCGKSTFARLLNRFISNVASIGINELGSKKVKYNIVKGVNAIFDDDANSPNYMEKGAVATRLKQLVTGSELIAEQLYTNTPVKAYVKVKLLACCNVFPNVDDESGAILRRSEFLTFTNSFTDAGIEDNSLFKRLESADSMSAIFNFLYARYIELVNRTGFTGLQEYDDNPYKKLAIWESEISTEDKENEVLDNNPVRGWLSDVLDFDDVDAFCTLDDLYDEYKLQAGTSNGLTIRGANKTIKSKLKSEAVKMGGYYSRKIVDGKRLRGLVGCKLNKANPFM